MSAKNKTSDSEIGGNARLDELGPGCFAYSADGCTNTGVIVGERGILVVDGQATPALAEEALSEIRKKTDKPVKLLVLTHFHADNALGSSAFEPGEIIASDLTRRMIQTHGAQDILVSRDRFPNVFGSAGGPVQQVMPSMTIASSMSIDLGGREVRLMHLGRGHTMGDMVVWVPESGVLFAGDLVQTSASPYCGDAHLADWPRALDRIAAFRPSALMPGRGRSAVGASAVASAVEHTREFVVSLREAASACVESNLGLKDTFQTIQDALVPQFGSSTDFEVHLPFNVARAYDEALGLDQPQVWTRERSADLADALSGYTVVSEDAAPEVAAEPEGAKHEGLPELAAEVESADVVSESDVTTETDTPADALVSDDDFAASLLASEEDDSDEVPLELSEDAIVEAEASSEELEGEEDPSEEKKLLEEAPA